MYKLMKIISLLNRKATLGRKFPCLGLRQSVATPDNIMQEI